MLWRQHHVATRQHRRHGMTLPLAAEQQSQPLTDASPRSRSAIWFAVGFAVAALLTAVATAFALSGAGVTGPASPIIMGVLAGVLALCLVLSVILAHRILQDRARIASGANRRASACSLRCVVQPRCGGAGGDRRGVSGAHLQPHCRRLVRSARRTMIESAAPWARLTWSSRQAISPAKCSPWPRI